jgi:hypothetical protein
MAQRDCANGPEMKKAWMMGLLMAGLVSMAHANTRFGFGTITAVDLKAQGPTFSVCCEFYNLSPKTFLNTGVYPVNGKHGDGRAYFLDGQPSTPEAALKVGRAICIADNEGTMYVSSQPGPQVPGAVGEVGNGIYRALLGGACQASQFAQLKRRPSITLLVDCQKGKVGSVVAVISETQNSDHILDPSTFQLQDGRLTGKLQLTLTFSEEELKRNPDWKPVPVVYDVDLTADASGKVTGSAKGTSGGMDMSLNVQGDIIARTPDRDAHRVWLYFEKFNNGHGYMIAEAHGGAVSDGYVLYDKGFRIGSSSAKGVTVKDGKLQGSVALKFDGKPTVQELTVKGVVLGNRLIFGTYRDADGVELPLRGGLVPLAGPQIEASSKEQREQVKVIMEEFKKKHSKP